MVSDGDIIRLEKEISLLQDKIDSIEKKSKDPMSFLKDKTIDPEVLANIKLKLNAKLVTSAPTWTGRLGDTVIYNNSGVYKLYIYTDVGWKSVGIS